MPTVLSWILFWVTQTLLETVISKPMTLPKTSLPMTRTFSEPATHIAVSSEPYETLFWTSPFAESVG